MYGANVIVPGTLLFVVIALGSIIAGAVAVQSRRSKAHEGVIAAVPPPEGPVDTFSKVRTGGRIGNMTASWPLVKVRVDSECLVISAPIGQRLVVRKADVHLVRRSGIVADSIIVSSPKNEHSHLALGTNGAFIESLARWGWQIEADSPSA